jgi:hypothetical protein
VVTGGPVDYHGVSPKHLMDFRAVEKKCCRENASEPYLTQNRGHHVDGRAQRSPSGYTYRTFMLPVPLGRKSL